MGLAQNLCKTPRHGKIIPLKRHQPREVCASTPPCSLVPPHGSNGWQCTPVRFDTRRGSMARGALVLAMVALAATCSSGFILGVDFGSEFMKVALVQNGKPFEVRGQAPRRATPPRVRGCKIRTCARASVLRGAHASPLALPRAGHHQYS